MNRTTSILSLSAMAHLLVIDLAYYFLSPVIALNFLLILTYNIIWLFIALLVNYSASKESERNHQA